MLKAGVLVAFVSLFPFVCGNAGLESYILLPANSPQCANDTVRDLTLYRQVRLVTGVYNQSVPRVKYVCHPVIQPMGVLTQTPFGPSAFAAFWLNRFFINGTIKNREDFLEMRAANDIHFADVSRLKFIAKRNFTYHDSLPYIGEGNSAERRFYFAWFTKDGKDDSQSHVTIKVIMYMHFDGVFAQVTKEQACNRLSGFWCGNDTNTCIHERLRCDSEPDCFEHGRDEANCSIRSGSSGMNPVEQDRSSWSSNFLWIALGILPLILLFALVGICSQRRQLDLSDDEVDYKLPSHLYTDKEGDESGTGGDEDDEEDDEDGEEDDGEDTEGGEEDEGGVVDETGSGGGELETEVRYGRGLYYEETGFMANVETGIVRSGKRKKKAKGKGNKKSQRKQRIEVDTSSNPGVVGEESRAASRSSLSEDEEDREHFGDAVLPPADNLKTLGRKGDKEAEERERLISTGSKFSPMGEQEHTVRFADVSGHVDAIEMRSLLPPPYPGNQTTTSVQINTKPSSRSPAVTKTEDPYEDPDNDVGVKRKVPPLNSALSGSPMETHPNKVSPQFAQTPSQISGVPPPPYTVSSGNGTAAAIPSSAPLLSTANNGAPIYTPLLLASPPDSSSSVSPLPDPPAAAAGGGGLSRQSSEQNTTTNAGFQSKGRVAPSPPVRVDLMPTSNGSPSPVGRQSQSSTAGPKASGQKDYDKDYIVV